MKLSTLSILISSMLMLNQFASGAPFTLSENAIMSLDDTKADGYFSSSLGATITAKRPHPGGGIELDVHFPSTKGLDYSLYLTSNARGGAGKLVGLDVSTFDEYQLKVTILLVDGSNSASPNVTAGAVIGPDPTGHGYGFKPFRFGLSSSASALLSTKHFSPKTKILGLSISLYGGKWQEGPHDLTVLVEPASNATPIQPTESTPSDKP